MSNPNLHLAYRWFEEVWNQRNPATIDELLTDESVCYSESGPICGVEEFKARQYGPFLATFPDLHVVVEDMVAEGDRVVVRWHFTGHRVANLLGGPDGYEEVTFSGMTWIRFARGKLMEGWQCSNIPKVVASPPPSPPLLMDARRKPVANGQPWFARTDEPAPGSEPSPVVEPPRS